jgi:hypothetical protein
MILYLLVIIDRPYYIKTIKHTCFKNCDELYIHMLNRVFKHLQNTYSRLYIWQVIVSYDLK